jgi:hypothetical protein
VHHNVNYYRELKIRTVTDFTRFPTATGASSKRTWRPRQRPLSQENRPCVAVKIEPLLKHAQRGQKRVLVAAVFHPHNPGGEVPQPEVELGCVSSIAGPELPRLGKFIRWRGGLFVSVLLHFTCQFACETSRWWRFDNGPLTSVTHAGTYACAVVWTQQLSYLPSLWLTRFVTDVGALPLFVRCTLNMYAMLVSVLVLDVHIGSTDNVAVNLVCFVNNLSEYIDQIGEARAGRLSVC